MCVSEWRGRFSILVGKDSINHIFLNAANQKSPKSKQKNKSACVHLLVLLLLLLLFSLLLLLLLNTESNSDSQINSSIICKFAMQPSGETDFSVLKRKGVRLPTNHTLSSLLNVNRGRNKQRNNLKLNNWRRTKCFTGNQQGIPAGVQVRFPLTVS